MIPIPFGLCLPVPWRRVCGAEGFSRGNGSPNGPVFTQPRATLRQRWVWRAESKPTKSNSSSANLKGGRGRARITRKQLAIVFAGAHSVLLGGNAMSLLEFHYLNDKDLSGRPSSLRQSSSFRASYGAWEPRALRMYCEGRWRLCNILSLLTKAFASHFWGMSECLVLWCSGQKSIFWIQTKQQHPMLSVFLHLASLARPCCGCGEGGMRPALVAFAAKSHACLVFWESSARYMRPFEIPSFFNTDYCSPLLGILYIHQPVYCTHWHFCFSILGTEGKVQRGFASPVAAVAGASWSGVVNVGEVPPEI